MREPKTINTVDREHLQETLTTPGYRVIQRIMESYIDAITEGCLALSEHDPLSHSEKVVNAWAYLSQAKRFRAAVEAGVKYEIEQLSVTNQQPVNLDEKARRQRVWETMGMMGEAPDNFNPPHFRQ